MHHNISLAKLNAHIQQIKTTIRGNNTRKNVHKYAVFNQWN